MKYLDKLIHRNQNSKKTYFHKASVGKLWESHGKAGEIPAKSPGRHPEKGNARNKVKKEKRDGNE